MAVSHKGKVDVIILTGGVAHSKMLTDMIKGYVEFIAPVAVMAGESEMDALALGGLRLYSKGVSSNIHFACQIKQLWRFKCNQS